MREPLLTRDREFTLAQRWRDSGDEAALHELVRSYTRLVVSTASRFRNYGLPMGDLVQEGNVGLMQAAARFEPDREVRFSTYAAWWIRSAMQDFVLRLTHELVEGERLTTLMVTHSMRQALDHGERTVMLHEGRVIWVGPSDELNESGNAYVDQFVNKRPEGPIQMRV